MLHGSQHVPSLIGSALFPHSVNGLKHMLHIFSIYSPLLLLPRDTQDRLYVYQGNMNSASCISCYPHFRTTTGKCLLVWIANCASLVWSYAQTINARTYGLRSNKHQRGLTSYRKVMIRELCKLNSYLFHNSLDL